MQEEQTVAFEPMEVYVPWYIGLFRLYLVLVMLLAIFRFVRLLWTLRRKQVTQQTESLLGLSLSEFWERPSIKARSFKTLSLLTFLVAVTVLVWTLSSDLMGVATQKSSSLGAVAGAFADALRTFAVGVIVSTDLFCCAAFCERLIHRQRLWLARTGNKAQPDPPKAAQ